MTARTFEQLGKLGNAELLLIAECDGHPDALEATRVIIGRQNGNTWLTPLQAPTLGPALGRSCRLRDSMPTHRQRRR